MQNGLQKHLNIEMDNTEKKKNIKELEKLASEVLKLKQDRKQRRPLLIEFCGSPNQESQPL